MERKTIFFNAKVQPVKPINQEFTLCKVYICALDKNRNMSYIGKEAAENALPTLYNCPVIGHIYEDENGEYHMGGHDMTIEVDDGGIRFKSLCVPYGVIPQQDNIHYEEVQESNGETITYIVGDAILWTGRFPELKEVVYSEDCWFGQSMEISVEEHSPLAEDNQYTNILKYAYSALCLLGKSDDPKHHTEPCFRSSRVEPYEFALNDAQFTELMAQFRDELASCFAHAEVEKGGETMNENETMTVTEETVVEAEVVDAPAEATVEVATTAAEFSEEATEIAEENSVQEAEVPVEEQPEVKNEEVTTGEETFDASEEINAPEGEPEHFSSTYEEKRQAINNALPRSANMDEEGRPLREVWYWLCDFDDAFAYVEENEWNREAGHDCRKGRFAYVYNEDTREVVISGSFEKMIVKWLTEQEVEAIESQRAQYEELVMYKNNREQKDRESIMDAAIAEFSYMSENEEYQSVYDNRYSFESAEALKNACYMIKGKYSIIPPQQRRFAAEPSVPISNSGITMPETPREKMHAEYGNK